jgi:hypothetical protein
MTCSRYYILIGDVHGCLTELQALICRIAPGADDTLVFLGDLVDKGPESPGVVRWVRHLSTLYRVVIAAVSPWQSSDDYDTSPLRKERDRQ